MPYFGSPVRVPRSLTSVLIVEPTLGLDASQPSVDAPLGSTPDSDNFIMREGGLELRPTLAVRGTNQQPIASRVLGGAEVIDVGGTRYPLISGTTLLAWYSNGSWSQLSYVSAGGVDAPPAAGNTDYWDWTQIYFDLRDENIAVGGNASYQTGYCWQANTLTFSTLTGAPRALRWAAFDNYLLAANVRSSENSDWVQRVQWSDRGSASSWTGGLSGYEDLLASKGAITRLLAQENRIIVGLDNEIWQGFPVDFPFVFRFAPLDTSVGMPYPWTVANTPRGIVFLNRDYQTYLLPKEGGPAVPIGQRLHRILRNTIDQPQRAWAAYDNTYSQYQLYYAIKGGSGLPQRAVYLNLNEGSWAPQSFDRVTGGLSLTRGFEAQRSSSATTWGGLAAQSVRWADLNMSWAELAGASEERAVHLGSSGGTMYHLSSNATSDAGIAVPAYWQSGALEGLSPGVQKTVSEIRVDYEGTSASSLTVKVSPNQGATFASGTHVALPTTSGVSQAIAYPHTAARYPMLRVEVEDQRPRLFRFHVVMRQGGR